MATHGNWSSAVYRVHVEGRTPGCSGKAPMVTMVCALPSATTYLGSHHEAVYLAAITAMSDALRAGHANLAITPPSEHLVEQMNGNWEVGDELRSFHDVAVILTRHFASVTWSIAPRTS